MYKLKVKNSEFTIPKDHIRILALQKAMENGIMFGDINNEPKAIEYLESIGIEVIKEVENV